MARMPLGGTAKDYDSKKSRATVINLIPEGDKGDYRTVRRADGLTSFATLPLGPCRSDLLVNGGFIYVVGGSTLYQVESDGTVNTIGVVGGTGRCKMAANAIPGDSQILILNGSGGGFIYSVVTGFVSITDPDFFSSSSVTVLNERFWLTRDDTAEFFGSDISDGTSYDALTFASAEESPDTAEAVISKKSALWILGAEHSEYWQSITDTTLPLRKVQGASKEWGILVRDTLAEVNESFAFLADDRTIRLAQGSQLTKISDLEFDLKVKGNGTPTYPGFTTIDDAYAFLVDGPVHSIYYITFPTEGYTWGFDLNSGLSHRRESEGLGYWRVNGAKKFGAKIICSDGIDGKLWTLDPSSRTENGEILRTTLRTPAMSWDKNVTIPLIEIDMEVAQTTDATLDPDQEPKMIVRYTKDGINYKTKEYISLGNFGEHSKRVPLRSFGRVVRNKDFALELIVTAPVGVQYYGAHIYPEVSI